MGLRHDLLDLVLPRQCAGCQLPGGALCARCRGLLLKPPLGCVTPTPCPAGLPPLSAFVAYEGAAQGLLLCHKERGQLHLTGPLGAALAAAALVHDLPATVILCPVPSSSAAVRQRGHDHAARLAKVAAARMRDQGVGARQAALLFSARRVADQSGLSTQQRAANLAGALVARSGQPCQVVVVDDVVTTGATLVEATRALRAVGHEVIGAATIAATTRRQHR